MSDTRVGTTTERRRFRHISMVDEDLCAYILSSPRIAVYQYYSSPDSTCDYLSYTALYSSIELGRDVARLERSEVGEITRNNLCKF